MDGFTALEAYSAAYAETGQPPNPTVFYRVVEAAEGVDAVQYWCYSVFDQFTVNFHWHDWELLQVFVDRASGRPLLLSASAHSRAVPNNEFLEPPGDRRPGVLTEVGSHSSASEINAVGPSFERLPTGDVDADVTNDLLDLTATLTAPLAYGLPRDEGARLPFVMPELGGHRLDDHPDLSVGPEAFVDERVTVGSWLGLPRPPADLPLREPGLVMGPPDGPSGADVTYELLPIGLVRDAVEDFVGPQLSFEFAIPGFVEDQFASHITSVGIPWEQPRFSEPLEDVTDPGHRQHIDGHVPDSLGDRVVGRIRRLGSGGEGALDGVTDAAKAALGDLVDASLYGLPVEAAVRLASEEPVATVTRSGVFGFLHVAPGGHQLTINGPGYAPLAVRFDHDGGLVRAGAAGELTLVSNEDAGWIRGAVPDGVGIDRVTVVERFAGVVFDGRPVEADRFAVAVHRAGRYRVEVVDRDGQVGAFRVGPADFGDGDEVIRERIGTGKLSLARALRDGLVDLRSLAERLAGAQTSGELFERLSIAIEAADGAVSSSERGDARTANERLSRVIEELKAGLEVLAGERQGGYSDGAVAVLEPRLTEAIQRAEAAIEAELSG
ncbi:MAG: hypothetical protein U5J98_05985 [Halobacteriales archaeon]|nr:hypothetical protein [Halobacteriales archaeon]